MREREKNVGKMQNASPTRVNVSISHYALGKNASQLPFSRVLLTFCLRFAHVFVHKTYQNANPTHSVIWASPNNIKSTKAYITLCIGFAYQHVGIKNATKTQQKRNKNVRRINKVSEQCNTARNLEFTLIYKKLK